MIAHLKDRAAALAALGWTGADAEWLAFVCLQSGAFLRSQYLRYVGESHPMHARRFVQRCRSIAVEVLYRPRVLGQWFDGIRFYAAASSPTRSRRT